MNEGKTELFSCFSQAANALAQLHITSQRVTQKAYNEGVKDTIKKLGDVLIQTKSAGNNSVSIDQLLIYLDTLNSDSENQETQKLRTIQCEPSQTRPSEQTSNQTANQPIYQQHTPFVSDFNPHINSNFTFSQVPLEDEQPRIQRNRRRIVGNPNEIQTTHNQQAHKRSLDCLMNDDSYLSDEAKRMRMSYDF
ncbi:hypothetical protein AKO1_002165 [Acrasis kona]|uniref:Uncharacterized protein n=1 Tax=Acrasis kona TaxID=1008807 RepID=A0AAW2Z9V6_9EUKA